jgi:hypothetical protein
MSVVNGTQTSGNTDSGPKTWGDYKYSKPIF